MSVAPLYSHQLDLPEAYAAAARIGRLFGLDRLDSRAVRHFARRWAVMAHRITGVDARGACNRFMWAAREAAKQAAQDRDETARAIKCAIKPMIGERAAWGALMAQAHDVNGANGFPLVEADVNDIVRTEVFYALPAAPRGQRHG